MHDAAAEADVDVFRVNGRGVVVSTASVVDVVFLPAERWPTPLEAAACWGVAVRFAELVLWTSLAAVRLNRKDAAGVVLVVVVVVVVAVVFEADVAAAVNALDLAKVGFVPTIAFGANFPCAVLFLTTPPVLDLGI